jgi:hypothetical protein
VVTVRELRVVVDGDSRLLPIALPVPHSYTAPEPVEPPLAVKVRVVAVPSQIVVILEANPVGAAGAVFTVAVTAKRVADTQLVVVFRACA